MLEGQSVNSYLTTMKEFRGQLTRMGDPVPDSTHAATILRNIPESWRSIAQTIRMIHTDVDQIEEKLEAHEADLNALEISTHVTSAFTARSTLQSQMNVNNPKSPNHSRNTLLGLRGRKMRMSSVLGLTMEGNTLDMNFSCYAVSWE